MQENCGFTNNILIKSFLIFLLLFFWPICALASTYGSGNYGSLRYNETSNFYSNNTLGLDQTATNSNSNSEVLTETDSSQSEQTLQTSDVIQDSQNINQGLNLIIGVVALSLSLSIFLYLHNRKHGRLNY